MFGSAPASALGAVILLFLDTFAHGATVDEWRGRSIYQVVTDRFAINSHTPWMPCQTQLGPYCGGQWRGMMENLDYIQGMGFDAIWISPIVAQLPQFTKDGQAYAGYWQQDLFNTNSRFGPPGDLKALIDAVHSRGMLFMLDIVVNHMAYNSISGGAPAENIDFTIFNPFNDATYYHNYCVMDFSGNNLTSLERCWLGSDHVPLADLNTESDIVQSMLGDWVEQIVGNWSVDGLRIDAGVNVQPDFFPNFVKKAGVFATAEVYHSNASVVSKWEEAVGSTLNYPLYWPMTSGFQSNGKLGDLADMIMTEQQTFKDVTVLGTFSENQDVPRFGNHTGDLAQATNVAAFVLMSDGIPIIYNGQEQHYRGGTNPYTNREPLWETGLNPFSPIYQVISTLNALRRHAMQKDTKHATSLSTVVHKDDQTLVMAKGSNGTQIISVFTNTGVNANSSTLDLSLSDLGYANGATLTEVLTCKNYTLDNQASLSLPMSGGAPAMLYPAASLSNSSLCDQTGKRFVGDVIQTITATTYTATISSTPTVVQSTVSYPIISSEITATTTAISRASSGRQLDSTLSLWSTALGMTGLSGLLGCLLVLL
ncbi:hypothetical protein LTR62_007068 [Meristemomyces frigidus]|uniref:alpha-amylase n=1 Tax=Meristemomyces frigidus TaxID=1508187 RepID=A0AAN7TB34_9PEZI|nr:hypothetical protein LTR62_007068 [Meristemomyces frigidus]